jgi:hypothetical protein
MSYGHLDKAALQSAQMQAVNSRLHKLVATSVEWTLHFSQAWHKVDSSYRVHLFSKIWYRIFV